jgi:DNA-binding transcriptional LysR family regulator
MEMSHVRYFLALREERNFTRAARRCGVTQPSLTQAIKTLEAELGAQLFHRRPTGTELSEFGVRIEPHLATIWQCVQEIKRMHRNGSALEIAPVHVEQKLEISTS